MVRSIITVLTGTVFSQVIGIAALPLLTRLYAPEAFGALQLYMSALGVLMMFAAFRYEIALLVCDEGRSLAVVLRLATRVSVIVTLGLALALAMSARLIERYPNVSTWVSLLVPATLIGGLFQTWGYLAIRAKDYNASAKSKIIQVAGYVVTAAAIGSVSPSNIGLLASDIIGRSFALATLVHWWGRRANHTVTKASWRELISVARRYKRYPLYVFPGTLLSAANAALSPYIIYGLFGLEAAGQYALVERSLMLPAGMIGAAIAQVFTGEFSQCLRARGGYTSRLFRSTVSILFLIAIVPCLTIHLIAPWLFTFVFDAKWDLAGHMAKSMVFLAFLSFIAVPVNMVLLLCNRLQLQAAWQVFSVGMNALVWGLIYFAGIESPIEAINLYVGASILVQIVYLLLADRVSVAVERG